MLLDSPCPMSLEEPKPWRRKVGAGRRAVGGGRPWEWEFNGDRVSVLRDERHSGDRWWLRLSNSGDVLRATRLYT